MCRINNRTIKRAINSTTTFRTLFLSFFFTLINSALLAPVSLASERSAFSIYSHASSLNYSEASAVYQMYKDQWQDFPKADGTHAFSRNRFIVGTQFEFQHKSFSHIFSLDYIERNDLLVRFNPDTAKIFYYQAQDRKLPDNQLFNIQLNAQQFAANGVRLGYQTPQWNNFTLGGRVSLLQGKDFQEGSISGAVSQKTNAQGKNEYEGQGQIDYHYQQDKILKHNLGNPNGQGITLDLKLNWHYQAWKANLVIEDALQYMRWYQLGHKDGGISTQNVSTDSTGTIRYQAMFSGNLGIYDYTPKNLPRYSRVEASHFWTKWQLTSGVWHYYQQTFPYIAGRYLWQHNQLGLGYELSSEKITFNYSHVGKDSTLSLTLGSNTWNPKLAHALEVQFVGQYQF